MTDTRGTHRVCASRRSDLPRLPGERQVAWRRIRAGSRSWRCSEQSGLTRFPSHGRLDNLIVQVEYTEDMALAPKV